MTKRWYIVHAYSNFEKKVASTIREQADMQGLGDLITEIEGQPVTGTESLQRVMNSKRGGDMLNLTIFRGGKSVKVQVKLGEAPQQL